MKRNLLEIFSDKILSLPLWLRQVVYSSLSEDLSLISSLSDKTDVYALYSPVLTYEGRVELSDKKCGWDSNIYNFLHYCEDNFSLAGIALNSYFSMEEVCKFFIFCLEQGYVEMPVSRKIYAILSFLSGKIRLGEYFVECGLINQEQLDRVLSVMKDSNMPSGAALLQQKYVSENDLKYVLALKTEAQTRFVLDCSQIPNIISAVSYSREEKDELSRLRDENKKLKLKLERLLSLVKNYEE